MSDVVEVMTGPEGTEIFNYSGVETREVMSSLVKQNPEMAALLRWSNSIQGNDRPSNKRAGGIFERDRYITPTKVFQQFRTAEYAAEHDDVVSGVIEATEALAFTRMSFLAHDPDEEDVWNQIAAGLDLDSRLRELWRELFKYSTAYCAVWFGQKSFKVRGTTASGNARRKEFVNLRVPIGMSLMSPYKVVPVGSLLFNQERLAYAADRDEAPEFEAALRGKSEDEFANQIVIQKYDAQPWEKTELKSAGLENVDNLYLLNPQNVWRHTATRAQYERFASVRMKSVFELLDMKTQLRQMDRVSLLGSTNFLVLIKKGTDQRPGHPDEIAQLQANVQTIAQTPIIVSDHRLTVEIVTPKTDRTLDPTRYDGLDSRIQARLYQMFISGNGVAGARADDSIKLAKVIAKGMESRRHMLRRAIEKRLIRPTVDTNAQFTEQPKLRFHPARIELSFDATMVQFLIDLRDRGDLSRESYLNEVDFDQSDEALLRKREKERFDSTFTPTNVPYGGTQKRNGDDDNPNDPRTAGRNGGGLRNGGGAAPGSGQGQPPRRGRPKDKE